MAQSRAAAARSTLESIVFKLPGGEQRDGQLEMCEAVADAIENGEHLVVEAGTGVGKSLAYLVAAVLSDHRVVVATARKPLQDQLIQKDIPFVATALPGKVHAAVLKGRSNYLCLAKLAEARRDATAQLGLDSRAEAFERLAKWADGAASGDLASAPMMLSRSMRSAVTVSAQECPGAKECPQGDDCLAERALDQARDAALVVTNIDLYCLDMAIGGGLLGDHDVVVIDEAHELESIASRILGLELGRRRLSWLAGQLRGLLVADAPEPRRLDQAGEALASAFSSFGGQRVDVDDRTVQDALTIADDAVARALEVLRRLPASGAAERDGRRPRCIQAASSILEDLRRARAPRQGDVAWVPEGDEAVLHIAPVNVGPPLAELIHAKRTTVLTSATLSVGGSLDPITDRLGLGTGPPVRKLRVTSPFDYRNEARLYCAAHLPNPKRADEFDAPALEELATLVEAAKGRTLALFTTHRMLRLASETLSSRFDWPVLVQDGPPEPGLIERFRDDEQSCLLATMGYWQGVDVPGRSLSLVVIDRLPFPPLRDPLLEARREAARAAGRNPFEVVDLPVAATLLAQGAGRLIRSMTDRGVVAVLDRRLARAGYRRVILDSLPPMRRMVDGDEVRRFLASIAE